MLPFETPSIYDHLPRFVFKMPRVVADQKAKFESDELFRKLSRESEVKYTGYRDRSQEDRQIRFQSGCREGHIEVAFTTTGTNLQLVFSPCTNGYSDGCDFEKEQGKKGVIRSRFDPTQTSRVYVRGAPATRLMSQGDTSRVTLELRDDHILLQVHITSSFIMNGVCVRWRGWIDMERLDGAGCLEYDEERAQVEDAILREQIDRYNQRLRDFEEKQRAYRAQQERHEEAETETKRKRTDLSPEHTSSTSN